MFGLNTSSRADTQKFTDVCLYHFFNPMMWLQFVLAIEGICFTPPRCHCGVFVFVAWQRLHGFPCSSIARPANNWVIEANSWTKANSWFTQYISKAAYWSLNSSQSFFISLEPVCVASFGQKEEEEILHFEALYRHTFCLRTRESSQQWQNTNPSPDIPPIQNMGLFCA